MTFDRDKSIDTAIENHKPKGDIVSKEAVASMMADVLKSYKDDSGIKAPSTEYAESMAHKLQEKLAAYGVTNLQIVDMNGDGFLNKGDKLMIATKSDLGPATVEHNFLGLKFNTIEERPVNRTVSITPHEHHAKQHEQAKPAEPAGSKPAPDGGPIVSRELLESRADLGTSMIDNSKGRSSAEFASFYKGCSANIGTDQFDQMVVLLTDKLTKHGHKVEFNSASKEITIDGQSYEKK